MSRLLFLSIISALVGALPACSDNCGPNGASDFGLVVGDASTQLVFGNLRSGANNDCPDPSAPAGVISLTIRGSMMDGTGLITLCAPRPDLMNMQTVPLVGPTGTIPGVRVIDLNGMDTMGCSYVLEPMRPPVGTAQAHGVCKNGADKAGYSLVVDGNVSLTKTCDTATSTVALSFSGEGAVKLQ